MNRKLILFLFGAIVPILIISCAGSGGSKKALEVPLDMPQMCHEIDFNLNVEMREVCGVKVRSYRSYKNIPQYRILIVPKNGKIVMKGSTYELRLQKMLPVALPKSFNGKLKFSESARRQYVKSKWDYQEFFPPNSSEMIKIMKIDIPLDVGGGTESVCYTVVRPPSTPSKIDRGFASQLEPLDCERFEQLKAQAG